MGDREGPKVEIDAFFGSYPSNDSSVFFAEGTTVGKNFSSLIAGKAEFAELRPQPTEPVPKRGELYKHQEFARRVAIEYDRLLCIAEPGTGKSCIISSISETFKYAYKKSPHDPTLINRAIILVKNNFLKTNIIQQIVCVCTDGVYLTDEVNNAKDETGLTRALTRAINDWATIMSYSDFAKKIQTMNPEEVEAYMSNKIIAVDEAHNIPTLSDKRKAQIEIEDLDEEPDFSKESYYDTMFRAFHRGKRNKIYLFTGTPFLNRASDIRPLINLILPIEPVKRLMPNWDDAVFDSITLEQIYPYFAGLILYIRALDTGAIAVDPEDSRNIDGFYSKVFPVAMSERQYRVYLQSLSGEGRGAPPASVSNLALNEVVDAADTKSAFFDKQRNISNLIFPDDSYASQGSSKYISRVGDSGDHYTVKNDANGALFRQALQLGNLEEYSAKYAEIVRICLESYSGLSPDQIELDLNKGIIYIYVPDFVLGSGAVALGLALEENGYQRFYYSSSIFITEGETRAVVPCPATEKTSRAQVRQAKIDRAKRYCLLTGSTPPGVLRTILNTLSSYDNRYGQYLQVVIGSRASREGININNAVKFIRTSSGWNPSTDRQARDRVFRATSSEIRIKEIEEYRRSQITSSLPGGSLSGEGGRVFMPIKVYNFASVYAGRPEGEPDRGDIFDTPNFLNMIDIQMYQRSEIKDRQIRRILRYMKQSSIDCVVNRERNIRVGDVPGSPTCDYTTCDYACAYFSPVQLDWKTKVLYYSDKEVADCIILIKKLFSERYSLHVSQIYDLIPQIDRRFVILALEKMIDENIKVLDRLGLSGFLREGSEGLIYIEKDPFISSSHQENAIYNQVIIGTLNQHTNLFNEYVAQQQSVEASNLMERWQQMDPSQLEREEFENSVLALPFATKVALLESALLGTRTPLVERILEIFDNYIYEFNEPLKDLELSREELAQSNRKRGRKANEYKAKVTQLKQESISSPETNSGERVLIHTLMTEKEKLTKYAETKRYEKVEGQLRIYKRSEHEGWRDTNIFENAVYIAKIQNERQGRVQQFSRFPIFGTILRDGKFRIRDRSRDPIGAGPTGQDNREANPGKVCSSWDKYDLVEILYRLRVPSPSSPAPQGTASRNDMLNYLTSKVKAQNLYAFSDDQLRYVYNFYVSDTTVLNLCGMVQSALEQQGALFRGMTSGSQTSRSSSLAQSTPAPQFQFTPQFAPAPQFTPAPQLAQFVPAPQLAQFAPAPQLAQFAPAPQLAQFAPAPQLAQFTPAPQLVAAQTQIQFPPFVPASQLLQPTPFTQAGYR